MQNRRNPVLSAIPIIVLPVLLAFTGLMAAPRLRVQAPPTQVPPSSATPAPAAAAPPAFDAISVKPSSCPRKAVQFQPGGRFVAPSVPVRILIGVAYGIPFSAGRSAIIGLPGWDDSQCFSVEAHADGDPPRQQMLLMLQSLLAGRFKLAAHWETRQLPIFALVVAKPGKIGPRLVPHAADDSTCRDPKAPPLPTQQGVAPPVLVPCGGYLISPGHIVAESTLADLAKGISWFQQIDRSVVDRTGLSGTFEITIDYAPTSLGTSPDADANGDPSLPSTIFTAMQEQLGLKLESATGPVDVLVIDHVEEPSPN